MDRLIDDFGRNLNYVRISVTDRCNYRCKYCMPAEGVEFLEHSEIMRYEEISFLCRVLWELGVRKVRFTGGEPLVRRDLVSFLKELNGEFPEMKTALTTNGSMLGQYAEELAEANLHSLNISLDTLDPVKFADVTRLGNIENVISGIRAAVRAGIRNIKLNTVLIRGFNDGEIGDLMAFAKREKVLLRLIEFMPLEDDVWNEDAFISGEEILKMLPEGDSWQAEKPDSAQAGPAKYYRNEKTGDSIGIITAVSNHFCKYCNRLRVSATGKLRTCLFAPVEIPMRPLILNEDSEGLKELILDSIKNKPRCWSDVRAGHQHMSGIGG
ncbi:MAG: GTP 3',8-cyclase MoaA [Synergistaceae bacterium]|jgi:cyclic pyranopterin phosphate synthase|nr:GTP 3',8-cyclase MoaA [Synergistaceae bacterium]PKL05439.1 MAG: GTP 3',8-cyclase MoaA [Synergistetes bacterium HGW-Synergistetes-1]MBP9559166.1 GTP 3',8-cyclase MoaA [Synergistaceae bacterium]MBP9975079.1 GTP 3',8-cyclase MoaA [Synergistaceae bacterium]MCE5183428.1 GTP 3',8-cyclase MoaA [Synergistaceae bacterium]